MKSTRVAGMVAVLCISVLAWSSPAEGSVPSKFQRPIVLSFSILSGLSGIVPQVETCVDHMR